MILNRRIVFIPEKDRSMIFFSLTNRSGLWEHWIIRLILLLLVSFYIHAMCNADVKSAIFLTIVPILILIVAYLFLNPYKTFFFLFIYNYFAMGIARYYYLQWGMGVEGLLILIYIGLLFKSFSDNLHFFEKQNELSMVYLFWFIYVIFQMFSPESYNNEAWLNGMRSVGLIPFLIIPLTTVFVDHISIVNKLLRLWAWFSVAAAVKAWGQLTIGFDSVEQAWLDQGGALTHIIWSGTRYFSFFTDAGQFGASMGHSGVVFAIVAIGKNKIRDKIFYMVVSLLSIYGMFLSGTRGAIAVPAAGFLMFLVMVKNWRLLIIGSLILGSVFMLLRFTSIGSGNAQITRMRTAFNPNDESLQVRLENQAKLKNYLADKPFGSGLGSGGGFGLKFYPEKLSSHIATDSWYVLIWLQMGIVGLFLHIGILLYMLFRGVVTIFTTVRDKELYFTTTGFICGFCGILLASYGNAILGQLPSCILCYVTMAIVFNAPRLQKNLC